MNNYSKFFFLFCLFPFFAQGQTNGQSGKLYQKPSSQSWSRPKAPTSSYITYYISLDNELQFIFSDKSETLLVRIETTNSVEYETTIYSEDEVIDLSEFTYPLYIYCITDDQTIYYGYIN
jgi:hypothetical protein